MNFDILGPIRIRDADGGEIRPPAGRERSLLVLLLINRGEVVSIDRIIEALWGDHPPGTAAKAVQGYVSHLRRMLDPERAAGGNDELLLTRAPGYSLRASADALDSTRFERMAAEAGRALEDGAAAEAVAVFDDALALWRGPALAEFAFEDFAQAEIRRLEDLRLVALEDRADALLQLGRNAEVAADLDALVAENPLRERLRASLMLALYRTGRQADALQAYRDGRRLLAGELGLEPGPELQRLEQAILAQDPALDGPTPTPVETAASERSAPPPGERDAALSTARPRRRLLLIAAGVVLGLVVAAAVGIALTRGETSSTSVQPPAVVAVDPKTNRVVASIVAGSKPISIAAGRGGVWVGDRRDGTVTEVDPVTRKVVRVIGIGAPAVDLDVGESGVWVATGSFGTLVRIDPELGAIADRIELGDPDDPIVPTVSSVGVGEGRVWAGARTGLVTIDPRSGTVTGRVGLGGLPALQLAVGNGVVWATVLASRAKRIDSRAAKETAEFYAGNFVYPIAIGASGIWIGGDPGQLWKVDPLTATAILSLRVGAFPTAIAVGAGAVWVTLAEEGLLVRIDPETGDVEERIEIGGSPEDVVVDRGLVWVAVQRAPPPQG